MSFRKWLLDLIYPPKCMLCHKLMKDSDEKVCGKCLNDLPEYDNTGRTVRHFEKVVVPFYYEGYMRDAILRYKFGGVKAYSTQFAKWMCAHIVIQMQGMFDMISWVPCSRRRRWVRGYDQSRLLAEAIAKELGVPCICTLKKIRHTPKQSKQKDEARRRANVLGAYKAVAPESFCDKRILLVDDVLTTGATMSECGKTLLIAGSGDLVCAVIAAARRNKK